MTQTDNYNLIIVEGTDAVNPLTQVNPNFETIDAQMKANEDSGIQRATELFTGTIHAITRLKPDADVFHFTAVSNFTAGDTFTVDGVQVTALLTSGEQLGSGAFIIGSEVICVLRDTLLTVFCNSGVVAVAQDSEKLGGQLPQFYGTAEDTETALENSATALSTANTVSGQLGNLAQLTTTTKSSLVGAVNEVNKNLAKYKLVWSNNDSTAQFDPQTISIDLSSYDYVDIEFRLRTTYSDRGSCRLFVGTSSQCSFSFVDGGTVRTCTRDTKVTTNEIIFGHAQYAPSYTGADVNDLYRIPHRIFAGTLSKA